METHSDFRLSDLDSCEHRVFQLLRWSEVPSDYVLQWIDGQDFHLARKDGIPVPENESNGAAVVAKKSRNDGTDSWTVTLYHEDGTPHMGMLKGFGASCDVPTLPAAVDAAIRAMRLDDQLATAE